MAPGDKRIERSLQLGDVMKMQPRGGLVENKENVSFLVGTAPTQEIRQLHALRLAARERVRRLPQMQIAQAHILQHLQFGAQPLHRRFGSVFGEKLQSLVHSHLQHIGNAFFEILHLQHLLLETLAVAMFAGEVQVGHELHLHLDGPLPLTGLATPALGVERKITGCIEPFLGQGLGGEQIPYVVESLDIGDRIGAARFPDRILIHNLHTVYLLDVALQAFVFERRAALVGAQGPLQGRIETLPYQGGLSRPTHARHHRHHTQRNIHRNVLQVVLHGTRQTQAPRPRPAAVGHFYLHLAPQIACGERISARNHLLRSSGKHHFTPLSPRLGPHVHDIVGRHHDGLVVFHHHNGVSQIAHLLDYLDKVVGIARMQTYAGFVENIEGAHQGAPQRIGQVDTLALASRQRGRGSVEAQIRKPHILEIGKPVTDFGEHTFGHGAVVGGEVQRLEEIIERVHLHGHQFRNRLSSHLHIVGVGAQARTVAVGAACLALVARAHDPILNLIGVLLDKGETVAYALGIFTTVPKNILFLLGQLFIGAVNGETLPLGIADEILFPFAHLLAPPHGHGIVVDRERCIGNHQVLAHSHHRTYALAGLACPVRIIETEEVDAGFYKTHAVGLEFVRKFQKARMAVGRGDFHMTLALALMESGLHGIEQTRIELVVFLGTVVGLAYHHAVHQQIEGIGQLLFLHRLLNAHHAGTSRILFIHPIEAAETALHLQLAVGLHRHSLGKTNRRENIEFGAVLQGRGEIGHAAHRMPFHLLARNGGIYLADAGIEQFEVFVDFGHRAHRGARIGIKRLLLDGDGRRNAVHKIHFGLAHPAQKLTGIGAEALHITPLPLGIERIEYQRGFARARKPGHDHHFP